MAKTEVCELETQGTWEAISCILQLSVVQKSWVTCYFFIFFPPKKKNRCSNLHWNSKRTLFILEFPVFCDLIIAVMVDTGTAEPPGQPFMSPSFTTNMEKLNYAASSSISFPTCVTTFILSSTISGIDCQCDLLSLSPSRLSASIRTLVPW